MKRKTVPEKETIDITGRKGVEEELKRKNEVLELIYELNGALNRGASLETLIGILARKSREMFMSRGASVYLLNDDATSLRLMNFDLPANKIKIIEDIIAMKIKRPVIKLKEGTLHNQIIHSKGPLILNDEKSIITLSSEFTESKTLQALVPRIVRLLNIKSVLAVPLFIGEKPIGMIDIAGKAPFSQPDIEHFTIIADEMSSIISFSAAKEMLESREKRYKSLFETANDAIFLIDGSSGEIIDANLRAGELLALDRDDIIGAYFTELHPDKERERFLSLWPRFLKEERASVDDTFVQRRDGTIIPVAVNANAFRSGDKRYIIGVYHDMTSRMEYEDRIRRMARAAIELVELSPRVDIYHFIGKRVEELAGDAVITVNEIDESEGLIRIKSIHGLKEDLFKRIEEMIESKLPGLAISGMSPEVREKLLSGKLIRIGSDLHEMLFGNLPKPLCRRIEKLLNIEHFYSIGLRRSGTLIGNVTILTHPGSTLSTELIETAVNQVSVALEKRQAIQMLRSSLREKETLLREVNHRVKNNMQVISSLLDLQSGNVRSEEAKTALKESKGRVLAMAQVHNMLYRNESLTDIRLGEYLPRLMDIIRHSWYSGREICFHTDLEDLSLSIDQAVPFSLVFNELLTNVFKHAFRENEKGEVFISLREQKRGVYELEIRDTGRGLIKGHQSEEPGKSLGLRLVRNIVKGQLNGSFTMQGKHGTTCKVRFDRRV